jgi:hypothetical protein
MNCGMKARKNALRIERLDHNAVAKRARCAGRLHRGRRLTAGVAEGLDAEPDQIDRADELECGEELRAGQNDCRDAQAAGGDVNQSAACRA